MSASLERSVDLPEMLDEPRTVGPRREPGALLFREARGHDLMPLPAPSRAAMAP